ncbi:MAG: AsmA family protein [Deltaproteobacteria bacterium]|nr:MAG: AsmA family protein [Deltaproteobacteria bacterium]
MKRWQKAVAIVVAVVVVLVIILSFVLDGILTSKAREQAQELSQEWGRPVQIGGVATKLLTGLGVRVSDVQIGAASGEDVPLVALERVEVRVALLRALFSGGKSVQVHSAEVQGLTVNVERLSDGTTNLQRFQDKLAESSEKKAKDEKQSDLSFLRVDHAALREGKVAFIDKATRGAKELAVQHLDVEVNDLRSGKPLEVLLKAAVLADKQNLEVRVKTAPLPVTLTPMPTSVALHVNPPIDIGPLGPFAGKDIGLESGTLDADFDAQLGAAVPGGSGPTAVKGVIKLAGLRFAGAEGGKKLDVVLDTDLKGDAAAGDMRIDKLRLDLGPAGITGHGTAKGLTSPSPRIEGLEIVSHDLDPARLAAYYPPLRKSLGDMFAGPIGLTVRASGTQAAQALELRVDLTPVRVTVPEQMAKAAGAPMTLVAHAKGAAANNGPIRFDAKLDLAGVDLRPGQSLDKKPGGRLDLSVEGTRKTNKSSTDPEQRIELADVKAHVLDDELQGKGWVEMKGAGAKATKQFDLDLASSHLDLDRMLMPSTKKKESKPLDPASFKGLSGHAKVQIARLTMKKQTVTDIVADVVVQEDHVKVNTAQLKAFGGTVNAGGTEMRLAHPDDPFHLVTKLDNVGLENLVALGSSHKLVAGKFNGTIDLRGAGDLEKTLAGVLDGNVLDGVFYGKDILGSVTGPLSKALPSGLAGKTTQGGITNLGQKLPFGVTIDKGVAKLKNPITISRPEAEMSFSGGMRMDGTLDLPGTVSLSPETISAITGGKVKPASAIPVTLKLVGPAWSPSVADLDLKPAVNEIVKQGGAALVGRAFGVDSSKAQQAAEQKAQKVQDEAQKRAEAEAAAQKKKVEEEAKNRLKGLFGK